MKDNVAIPNIIISNKPGEKEIPSNEGVLK